MISNHFGIKKKGNIMGMKRQTFIGNQFALVDTNTGVLEGTKIIVKKVNSAKFMRVYLEDIAGLICLSDGEIKMLQCIWEISEYNTNRVILTSAVKKDIEEKLNKAGKPIKIGSMNNIISKLSKRGILIAVPDRAATFILNPKYFWKGEELERGNTFKLTLQYETFDDVKEITDEEI